MSIVANGDGVQEMFLSMVPSLSTYDALKTPHRSWWRVSKLARPVHSVLVDW